MNPHERVGISTGTAPSRLRPGPGPGASQRHSSAAPGAHFSGSGGQRASVPEDLPGQLVVVTQPASVSGGVSMLFDPKLRLSARSASHKHTLNRDTFVAEKQRVCLAARNPI